MDRTLKYPMVGGDNGRLASLGWALGPVGLMDDGTESVLSVPQPGFGQALGDVAQVIWIMGPLGHSRLILLSSAVGKDTLLLLWSLVWC